jgi:hypothetical protein
MRISAGVFDCATAGDGNHGDLLLAAALAATAFATTMLAATTTTTFAATTIATTFAATTIATTLAATTFAATATTVTTTTVHVLQFTIGQITHYNLLKAARSPNSPKQVLANVAHCAIERALTVTAPTAAHSINPGSDGWLQDAGLR